jgi:hypothetical protein
LELEFGNAGEVDTQGGGWFIGFSPWTRSACGLRHMPQETLASGLCVKWFAHEAGDPNGEAKPISQGRTMSILVGADSEFRIDFSPHAGFDADRTVSHTLRRSGDFVIWGAGIHHRACGVQAASILTIRWMPQ